MPIKCKVGALGPHHQEPIDGTDDRRRSSKVNVGAINVIAQDVKVSKFLELGLIDEVLDAIGAAGRCSIGRRQARHNTGHLIRRLRHVWNKYGSLKIASHIFVEQESIVGARAVPRIVLVNQGQSVCRSYIGIKGSVCPPPSTPPGML